MRAWWWLIAIVLICLVRPAAAHMNEGVPSTEPSKNRTEPLRVLLIDSFHFLLPWSIQVRDGLVDALTAAPESELYVEHLDSVRTGQSPEVQNAFFLNLDARYADKPIDAIVLNGPPAVSAFVAHLRPWMRKPLIISLTQDSEAPAAAGVPHWLKLTMPVSEPETIRAFRDPLPGRRVLVLCEGQQSPACEKLRPLLAERYAQADFRMVTPMSIEEAVEETRGFARDGLLLFFPLTFKTADGRRLLPVEILTAISRQVEIPIFVPWTTMLEHGAVGGWLLDGRDAGRQVVDEIRRLLAKPATVGADFAKPRVLPRRYVYDARKLEQFDILEERLPPGSEIRNRPISLWEHFPREAGLALVTLILLGVALVFCIAYLRSDRRLLAEKHKAEELLRRSNAELELRVTERTKALEETIAERERAIASEQAALKTRENFIEMISHEVRSPMSVLSNSLGLLRTLDLDSRTAVHFERMTRALRRLAQIVDRGLGQRDVSLGALDPLDPVALVEQVVADAGVDHPSRSIAVVIDPTARNVRLSIDGTSMQMALLCVVDNALKYSSPSSTVHLRLARQAPDQLRFDIMDSGIGVPPEDADAVFLPGQRGGNSGTVPGTGVGLSAARDVIRQAGGSIALYSTLGEGTIVTIVLPCASEAAITNAVHSDMDAEPVRPDRSERPSPVRKFS